MNSTTRFVRCFTILLVLIYLPLPGFSQSAPDDKQALADRIVEQFALKEQLNEAPDDIREQFEQNPLGLAPEENEQLLQHFTDAYQADLLVNDFKTALHQYLADGYADTLSQKLDEPNIRAVTDAQQEFYTLQGKRRNIITKYEIEQDSPSQDRSAAISALVDTTGAAGGSIESSIIILRSIIKAVGSVSEQQRFTDSQIDMIASNFRTQMQAEAPRQTNERLMVTYHNVDTDILEQYVTFMQSDTGQQLDQAISQSIQSAYKAASDRLLQGVTTDQ